MNFDTIINGLLTLDPSVFGLLLGGAVGVSLLTQGVKKFFDLTNEKHVVAVFHIIALMASGLDYFLTSSNLPPTVLGVNTLLLTSIATPIYFYAIKPLTVFISAVNMYKNRVLEKVNEVQAVVLPVAVPVIAEPIVEPIIEPEPEITTPSVITADF